jgi:hypothetical protein
LQAVVPLPQYTTIPEQGVDVLHLVLAVELEML